jgi:hypothetical protein
MNTAKKKKQKNKKKNKNKNRKQKKQKQKKTEPPQTKKSPAKKSGGELSGLLY